jgi:SAM-dependent methyltransferase
VERRPDTSWDRSADLERIRATYAGYSRDHRERLWDPGSAGYARLVEDLDRALLADLHAAVRGLSAPTVVDLGCGTGELAATGAPMVGRWIGVDLREDAVNTARTSFPQAEFVVASADAVPLETASADVVVARVLFSSFPTGHLERAVAAEIARILRPGGWLVWLDIRYSNPTNREVHGLTERWIAELFDGWEPALRARGLLPPIARRLGPLTPVAYPLLSALRPLRSHLVGRLRRPADASD